MKNLVAAAVLCSVSVFIGIAGGAGMTHFQSTVKAAELYEIVKTCQILNPSDDDSNILYKLMYLKAMNSESEETKLAYEEIIFKRLVQDAAELDKQIKEDITDSELQSKKKLLKNIEDFFAELDTKRNS